MPEVSLIVSTNGMAQYENLPCCLYSLLVQTYQDFEVIITDNGYGAKGERPRTFAEELMRSPWYFGRQDQFKYVPIHDEVVRSTCYHSAEYGASLAIGKYLGFPSDDSYYVPEYLETMVDALHSRKVHIAHCDLIYDRRYGGRYQVMNSAMRTGAIDKTSFLIEKESFFKVGGFPEKKDGSFSDGLLAEKLQREGYRSHRVDEVLCYHN